MECGSSTTDILYNKDSALNPIDTIMLTRYQGPIKKEAIGPKLANIKQIEEEFILASSMKDFADNGNWRFEQWNASIINR